MKEMVYQQNYLYYEIELSSMNNDINRDSRKARHNLAIKVRDITFLIRNQHRLYDFMYLDAIETNFSHEQMTPLNLILAHSLQIEKRFKKVYSDLLFAIHPQWN
jgi:hypothetical protein